MLPHAGQGASMAIEDGIALATILADTDRASVSEALGIYQSVRRERTSRVQATGRANSMRGQDSTDLDTRDQTFRVRQATRAWIWTYDAESEAAAALNGRPRVVEPLPDQGMEDLKRSAQ
jgi:salicylate hydroxylase